ncbi:peptidase C39 family protein [Candidatus Saccharibacteria bacterium]|nr:peptidase C39 family protein [Candidatus Saccharibacteria bacterium]
MPFISNAPDDLHCLQAAYGMIRQFFEPEWQFDLEEWSQLTGFEPGHGSCSSVGLLWFHNNGYDVQHITKYDYRRFVAEGNDYQYEAIGREAADWEAEHFNMDLERERAARMVATGMWQHRAPGFEDIKLYLERGYIMKCLVNLNELNDKPGYLGHAVVVIGYSEDTLIIHDPGLPPRPSRMVSFDKFLAAWADPNANMEKLDAIKLKTADEAPHSL